MLNFINKYLLSSCTGPCPLEEGPEVREWAREEQKRIQGDWSLESKEEAQR